MPTRQEFAACRPGRYFAGLSWDESEMTRLLVILIALDGALDLAVIALALRLARRFDLSIIPGGVAASRGLG
jgi:hypothetical protein